MNIKLSHKLVITYGVLFILSLCCAAMLFWSAAASRFHSQRANLAHESYEAHLKLSNNTYQLLKEYNKNLIMGDSYHGLSEKKFITSNRNLIDDIHQIILKEIDMVGDEELEELEELEKLRRIIHEVISQYQAIQRNPNITRNLQANQLTQSQHTALSNLLNGSARRQINQAINSALDEERREVIEARALLERRLNQFYMLSVMMALLSLLLLAPAFWMIYRKIHLPLRQIIDGAARFTQADWQHRINVNDTGELRNVADAFNHTAKIAGMREADLAQHNQKLETVVQERTSELRTALLDLEEQNTLRQRLLADVSHELRTPLTIIRGEVDVALRGKEKTADEYQDALHRVGDAARHTASLVEDVLFVARKEAGQSRLALHPCDITDIVQECVDVYIKQFEAQGISLSFDNSAQHTLILCDKKRIRQVILILLENIRNHAKNVSRANIYLTEQTNSLLLTVADNGAGMSQQEINKVFERFFRGSNAAIHYQSGVGLGLPVAKAIVEAHQGQIDAVSTLGNGASFVITLPKTAPEQINQGNP